MIKATAKVNGETITKFFDTMGHAIQWVRSLAFSITDWKVYDADGKLYYAF